MAIIRWNPWSIDRFLDEDWDIPTIPGIARLAGQGLNLYETEDAIIAEAALPGIPEDKIDLTIDDGIVRIFGTKEEKEDGRKKYMSTLSASYNYSFRLPQGIAADQEPVCELSEGVLSMRFPKMKKTAPKRLKVTRTAKSSQKNITGRGESNDK